MRRYAAALSLLLLAVSACGPIIGQLQRLGEGVQEFRVVEGDLRDFAAARQVLVYAPFTKGERGSWVVRGEDEASLAEGFAKEGLFATQFFLERDLAKAREILASLPADPAGVKARLGLAAEPDAILTGVILERETIVAPLRGLVLALRYRLTLRSLVTGRSATVEIAVKDILSDEALKAVVQELTRRVRQAS